MEMLAIAYIYLFAAVMGIWFFIAIPILIAQGIAYLVVNWGKWDAFTCPSQDAKPLIKNEVLCLFPHRYFGKWYWLEKVKRHQELAYEPEEGWFFHTYRIERAGD
jgi:hypothetical protein